MREATKIDTLKIRSKRYHLILDALHRAIPNDVSPGSNEYKQIANICEACFLACHKDDQISPEEIISLVTSWQLGYSCWLDGVMDALNNADLSFVNNSDQAKAQLRAAFGMIKAWVWHLDRD